MDEKLHWDLHDIVVRGSYELRIREDGIGGVIVEAWREETVGGERTLFDSARADDFDIESALTELWENLCS